MDIQLSAHIRNLLLDYVQYHITTDYVQFTEAAVAELVSLEQIPEHDPTSLTLPSDPFTTLSFIHNFETLPTYQEKFATTQDARTLLKSVIGLLKGQLKSERLVWGRTPWDERENDAFYRVESILTRRAMRETPVLGKTSAARPPSSIEKIELDSYFRLMASKPILLKAIGVKPVQEPQVNLNQTLDVVYNIRAADHTAVRSLLQSVAAMSRPPKVIINALKKDYRHMYLPLGFVFDPPRPETPPPDSPPLTPIFPRNARYTRSGQDAKGAMKSGVLSSYADLPERIGVVPNTYFLDSDEVMVEEGSANALARANMVIVDGWQTYAASSPLTVCSLDDEVDELADMFPLSPDTSVTDAMNLVQDIEDSKFDEVQIPKERRIGGSLGLPKESIVDKARKAGGLGAFLGPLLKPSELAASPSDLHSLLYKTMGGTKDNVLRDSKPSTTKVQPLRPALAADVDSMHGQASTSSSLVSSHEEAAKTEEDNEIRGLYQDLSQPGEKRLCPPLSRKAADPKALIRDERLFDEESKGEAKAKKTRPRLELIPVPLLPEPNVGVERKHLAYVNYLVGPEVNAGPKPPGHKQAGKAGKVESPLRFLKNTKKGMAPLRVALSWVPFTLTTPIPAHGGILQNDLEGGEAMDALLERACIGMNTKVRAGEGCGFNDDKRWRKFGEEEKVKDACEFSAEIAKCEIILTRREREALLGRGRRATLDERGVGNEACEDEQVDDQKEANKSATEALNSSAGSMVRKKSMKDFERCDEISDSRLAKRPRLSADDSVIGFLPHSGSEDPDGPFPGFDDHQETSLRTGPMDTDSDFSLGYDNDIRPNHHDADALDDDIMVRQAMTAEGSLRPGLSLPFNSSEHGRYNGESPDIIRRPDNVQVRPQPLLAPRDVGKKQAANDFEQDGRTTVHKDRLPKKLDVDLASCSLGIEAFAKLRAKVITSNVVSQLSANNTEPRECDPPPVRIHSKGTPHELYDNSTVRIPSTLTRPTTSHRYMASIEVLQKQVIVRTLGAEFLVELVERDSLNGIDLIIDPITSVVFASLLSLPAHSEKLLNNLSMQSWRFQRILIVFEAYPESRSLRQRRMQGLGGPEPDLYAYTPPIVKAIKRFRRDVNIAEGCGKKAVACEVWYAFANSVSEAAASARLFGDEAERADWTGGALWGDREWLDIDPSEDEENLASGGGMNRFSASIVLCQMTLQQFLDREPEDRLAMAGPFIGTEAITTFNEDMEQRMQVVYEAESSDIDMSLA